MFLNICDILAKRDVCFSPLFSVATLVHDDANPSATSPLVNDVTLLAVSPPVATAPMFSGVRLTFPRR